MPDLQPPKPSEEAIARWRERRSANAQKQPKPNLKKLAETLKKRSDDHINRLEGTLLRTAGAGGKCLVRLTKPWKGLKELPATAIDGCTAHKRVVLFRGRDGDWFALGKGNEKLWTQREAARRGVYRNPFAGTILYVLTKTVSGEVKYYVCGGEAQCKEVFSIPVGSTSVFGGAFVELNNLGQGKFLFSIYYRLLSGLFVFRLFDQDGLVDEYYENDLKPYRYNFSASPPGGFSQSLSGVASGFFRRVYGYFFFYSVGFGRFAANYCQDANTVESPLGAGQDGTATTTGNLMMLISLNAPNPQDKVKKTLLPVQTASKSGDNYSDRWLSIPAFGSLQHFSTSFLTGDRIGGVQSGDSDMRYLLKASESGRIGISETQTENENLYVVVNNNGSESRFIVQGTEGGFEGITESRFIAAFSSVQSTGGWYFCDLIEESIAYIERSPANQNAKPVPIPDTNLYQIERSREVKEVTVQILDLKFEVQGDITVSVFPPDINQGETSNFGTVVAASYAPGNG